MGVVQRTKVRCISSQNVILKLIQRPHLKGACGKLGQVGRVELVVQKTTRQWQVTRVRLDGVEGQTEHINIVISSYKPPHTVPTTITTRLP